MSSSRRREVVRRDVGDQRHQDAAPALVGGEDDRQRCFVLTADAAEEIELPRQADADHAALARVVVVVAEPVILRRAGGDPYSVAGGGVHLRIQERPGDAGARPRLLDAGGRDADVEVVRHRLPHEVLQRDVVEHFPPGQVGERLRLLRLLDEAVGLRRLHLRPLVVRADRRAAGRQRRHTRR